LVTVHDVAARSGVSIATVSRTLREPHRVAEDTRDRVLAAVRELDYRPNRAASSLRRGRTGVIALVVPDIENPYFASLIKGAQASSRARGYGLVVIDTTEQADVEAEEIVALRSQIDGIILASSRLPDARLAEAVAGLRCVLINRDPASAGVVAPTVTIDEHSGANDAVRHLYAQGHRRIAYVGGPARSWSQSRRLEGIRDAAASLEGVVLLEVGSFAPDAHGGRAAAAAALAEGPTAVIAYNDLVALGLLAQWSESGVRVPEDISLVGFDNTFVTELSSPRLTSVGADLRAFGETAVELLLHRIDSPEVVDGAPHPVLPPRLVVRDSTAAARGLH
jgi:DNA-binding LacI/PurR family transcriptional regulator